MEPKETSAEPKTLRVRLGPVASDLIEGSDEPPAAALDRQITSMKNDGARLAVLEDRDQRQTDALIRLAAAQDRQSDVVAKLFTLVDFRTRELANLFLHISTLVGTRFADGDELERLHRRLGEIALDFDKDAKALSETVRALSKDIEQGSGALTQSLEDQRLTLTDRAELTRPTPGKDRGYER